MSQSEHAVGLAGAHADDGIPMTDRLLTPAMIELLRAPSPCFLSTTMPDGSPQLTETWVDTDDEHILINTVDTHQKTRNIARDPRVAVAVLDADQIARYVGVRGTVVDVTTDGARDHIEFLAQKYLGRPYPNFSGKPETRVLLTIRVDRIVHPLR